MHHNPAIRPELLRRCWQLSCAPLLLGALALGSVLVDTSCRAGQDTAPDTSSSEAAPFAVGTSTYEWIDLARPEELTPEAGDVRQIVARAWYPAAPSSELALAPYFLNPRQAELNEEAAGFPPGVLSVLQIPARVDAPLVPGPQKFPVLIFSPGMSTPLEYYGYQLAELASRGYVILALSHAYATGIVVYSDGHVAAELPEAPGSEVRDRSIANWSLDQRLALDRLEQLASAGSGDRLQGRLDLARVGVFGHSRGGAAAALSCLDDMRFRACANLDGGLSTSVETKQLTQPFLLMRSEVAVPTLDGFFEQLTGPAHRVSVAGAGHNSFSDLPRLVALLREQELPLDPEALLLGSLAPERAFAINAAYLSAFFGSELSGAPATLFSSPSPYPEVEVTNLPRP
jgi:hypothetical protein